MPQNKGENSNPELTFEQAMERLESIVAEMESDKIPLEDLLVQYEEGINLVQVCTRKLDEAEKRIEILTRTSSGKPKLEEFQPAKVAAKPERNAQESEDVSLF